MRSSLWKGLFKYLYTYFMEFVLVSSFILSFQNTFILIVLEAAKLTPALILGEPTTFCREIFVSWKEREGIVMMYDVSQILFVSRGVGDWHATLRHIHVIKDFLILKESFLGMLVHLVENFIFSHKMYLTYDVERSQAFLTIPLFECLCFTFTMKYTS